MPWIMASMVARSEASGRPWCGCLRFVDDHDPVQLLKLLSSCRPLRAWASERGIVLDDGPDSLSVLNGEVDEWSEDPRISSLLGNEVGCYLGTVIVKNIPGTSWRVWPNGHPVVRLSSGRDLDVIAKAGHRVRHHRGSLMAIFRDSR